ncbi:hypothetical protein F5144DRAFT_654848 [Chaetomium tenue]|uniref:Uncharacterized protein n=1 Tax=Chaetomium tenue TaxID=1854479 RepID=A0ACB7P394_9PEZI|nr:hypothetical protein F5144DRAFT_654848 [Chaetomium globosum]
MNDSSKPTPPSTTTAPTTAPPPPQNPPKRTQLPQPQPQPATLLLDDEIARREGLATHGRIQTGCYTLDEHVLLGGLDRGSVVGVSVEEEEEKGVGLAIGLQTAAGLLVDVPNARVMVVTTLPVAGLLPKLRAALVAKLTTSIPREGLQSLQSEVKGCLERISIARVFDVEGLWEVLRELEEAVAVAERGPPQPAQQTDNKSGNASPPPAKGQRQQRTEVLDSEDEGGLSSPESPPSASPPRQQTATPEQTNPSTLPDMILITHTSTLLNTLFTGRDKETAHSTTQLLATHLRTLTRSPSHGGPLVMLLNSTTSPYAHPNDTTTTTAAPPTDSDRTPKQLNLTLRSIFNPPPAPQPGHVYALAAARRSKPSFGLVFSQMLDVHLLCTRVPRTRGDIAALVANPGVAVEGAYVWVVEVLLDETGVYGEREAGGGWDWGERRCREQRWGAVDVDGEGRVVDAVFE